MVNGSPTLGEQLFGLGYKLVERDRRGESKMRLLKVAVRWGAWIALSNAVLDIVFYILVRFRWYRDTAWF